MFELSPLGRSVLVLVLLLKSESFYGSPPNISLTEIAGFETSSRPYILKYGAPCHPNMIVPLSFAKIKACGDYLLIAAFVVSNSHETFVRENRCFWGGLS